VDLAGRTVTVKKKEVHLTATEYALLRELVRHAGKVVMHAQLLRAVWGPNSESQSQYLRVYITHLRKKLETSTSGKLIQTEPGIGYRLLARGWQRLGASVSCSRGRRGELSCLWRLLRQVLPVVHWVGG